MTTDERLMGRIESKLDSIETSQNSMRDEFRDFVKEDRSDHARMLGQMQSTNTDVAKLCGKLTGHIHEDNRRFSLVHRVLFLMAGSGGVAVAIVKVFT